jgi:hypothetical protein
VSSAGARTITITVELSPEQAAGLKRFAEKSDFTDAMDVLYPHIARPIRADQAHTIICALAIVNEALIEADVSSWPWIDCGHV